MSKIFTIPETQISNELSTLIYGHIKVALAQDSRDIIIALSGGNSPVALHRALAEILDEETAHRIIFMQIDERVVESTHSDSNQKMIRETVALALSKGARFLPMDVQEIESSALNYTTLLNTFSKTSRLFLALLGVGDDGHTASIFPGDTQAASESDVFLTKNTYKGYKRLSLSYYWICRFELCYIFAPGEAKQKIIRAIDDSSTRSKYPASELLHRHENARIITTS